MTAVPPGSRGSSGRTRVDTRPHIARYDVHAMNKLLARRPEDAWAATISKQNG